MRRSLTSAIVDECRAGDEAAIIFAAAFYQALGFGRDIETAYKLGKSALKLEGIPEDQIPELHHRQGIKPAEVVLPRPSLAPPPNSVQSATGQRIIDNSSSQRRFGPKHRRPRKNR